MTVIIVLTVFAIVATACYINEHFARITRSLGFGYLIYHSDSQKVFFSLTYCDAVEWMKCAIGDVCIVDNRSQDAISIRFASK